MQIYYLQDIAIHDTHDTMCCCAIPGPLPHQAIGANLYKLDFEGALAWHSLRVGRDVDGFANWCQRQVSQGTYYGLNIEAAKAAAIQQARLDDRLIINVPRPQKLSIPDSYQDSRVNYRDIALYYRYYSEPENPPLLVPDEAPFPIWIISPGWRMCRLSDVVKVTDGTVPPEPENIGALLTLSGVVYAPTIDPLGVWGWKDALKIWQVKKTGDSLVFWCLGKV